MSLNHYFATCPKGLDPLLESELRILGAQNVRQEKFGVWFEGDLDIAYQVCLWSRLANKVVLLLGALDECDSSENIYQFVRSIDWYGHMLPEQTLSVEFVGKSDEIRHTHFGAVRVKDAIVDQFRAKTGSRPNVANDSTSLRIYARLHKKRFTLGIDLVGDSLHRRGYRRGQGAAPLKENLAAAILLRAAWPGLANEGYGLLDPMCGSGTLLIEAAMMCADIAPSLSREGFAFENWLGHVPEIWQRIREDALQRRTEGMTKNLSEIIGYDADPAVIRKAQQNINAAGLDGVIRIGVRELAVLEKPENMAKGLLVTNPPYGERLGEKNSLLLLYEHLGSRLKAGFGGWKIAVFTGNEDLSRAMHIQNDKNYQLFNGPIECRLLLAELYNKKNVPQTLVSSERLTLKPEDLSQGALTFFNRLRKNVRHLDKWARKNRISCYRIYDADVPEYAVAVDRYADWLQVTEYAPPKSIDPVKALQRFRDVQQTLPAALSQAEDKIVYKQRRQQKGSEQYERLDQQQRFLQVQEGECRLLVNLHDYLDTGLFLDHRPLRLKIASMAKGKRFLNLFSYTAVASLHAALGGAAQTTSVDMSATYLAWARKNFALNGLSEIRHKFVQADCLQWLGQCDERYDLIFLDPPSFSNSKKMQGVLDVQRDHAELIDSAMSLLSPDGLLIFSNNLKSFKLDAGIAARYHLEDMRRQTIDEDFKRRPTIHHCWFIRA